MIIHSTKHLDNFSKAAAFFAKLQAPDGGMKEAEDNSFENTDNTLEAIWVWSRYYELTGDNQYFDNITRAYTYSNTSGHYPWNEPDSGKVYSCAWALRAEIKFREAYNNWSMSWFANFSASRIIVMEAWEPSPGFTTITKHLIKGWGAGNLYDYGISVGDDNFRTKALQYGNESRDNVTATPSLLSSEGWALAGGALMWGITQSTMQEFPDPAWVEAHAPDLKTSVPNPGVGPGNSQNGWEAWYAFGHKGAYDIAGNIIHYLNFMNMTHNIMVRDGDADGGIPTNIGDPDDTDESWVTSYLVFFCLEPFTQLGAGMPPSAPDLTSVQLSGTGNENVTITWNSSPEPDVILYEIYNGTTYDPNGTGYTMLDTVLNTTNSYVHIMPSTDSFYIVKARDMKDWRTPSSNQGARISMNFKPGRNFVSFPLPLTSTDPATTFQDMTFDCVWYYNSTDTLDHWKQYNPSKTFNDLTYVDYTMGFWFDITQESNMTAADIIPQSTPVQLYAGWNFVSYPSFIDRTVSDALSGINYERVEGFNPISPQSLMLLNDTSILSRGSGYWIKVSSGGIWTVDNT